MKKTLLICVMAAGVSACCQTKQREEYKTTYEYVPVYEQVITCPCCQKKPACCCDKAKAVKPAKPACGCAKAKPAPKAEKKSCGCGTCAASVKVQPKTETVMMIVPSQQVVQPVEPVVKQEIIYPYIQY